jgi:hypothetical protein
MSQTTLPVSPQLLGTGFFDTSTGLTFEFHHPRARPDVWAEYLDGAHTAYAKYGVGEAINRPKLNDAEGVSTFALGRRADGKAMAGVRFHGPLNRAEDSSSLVEMALSSEVEHLREQIRGFIAHGVVEIKGAWSLTHGPGPHSMFKSFNRCVVYTLQWLKCEFAIATLAEQHIEPVVEGGAHLLGEESVPFPTEDYRTVLMVWRRSRLIETTVPEQLFLERTELSELRRPAGGEGSTTGRLADESWRPLVLDCRTRGDRAVAERLATSGVTVIDRLADQRRELEELRPAPGPEVRNETPRWIYYPWRRTLCKVVGPRGFELLRLDRNRHKITAGEQARLRQMRIGVVGLSVGHAIAHGLAMEGLCGELRLADFDEIATTNLNRIPATLLDIGLNKTVAAARRIAEIDPYLPVAIWPGGVTEENIDDFLAGLDLVVEECDSLDIKVLLRETARRHRIPVLMETSDRGLLDVERYDLEPDRELFHGLLAGVSTSSIAGLSMRDKVPYVLRILEPDQVSTRAAASLAEVGKSLSTWPQLGGDVTLGAATTAAAVRRLARDGHLPSGRVRVDTDALLDTIAEPSVAAPPDEPEPVFEPLPSDPLLVVAYTAGRAPSGGNVQPWRFELSGEAFSVYLDPAKSVTMDVAYRGSYVGIGAALFNAKVAAAAQGVLGRLELFPGDRFDGPVGVLSFGSTADPDLARLFEPALRRVTNRKKGTPGPIDPAVQTRLAIAAETGGGKLHLLTDRGRLSATGELLGESDRLRFLTPDIHREMMRELRFPGRDSLESGLDVRTLELDGAALAALTVSRRPDVMAQLAEWDAGQALGDSTREAVASCSAIAVVTTMGSQPVDFVRCGETVMRVWLAAEASGLAVHPVSPLFIYAHAAENFQALVGERYASRLAALAGRFRGLCSLGEGEQLGLVLRLSHAPAPSFRSTRLPLDAVLRVTTPEGSGPRGFNGRSPGSAR